MAAGEGGFAADDSQRCFQIVGKGRQHLFLHVSFLLLVSHEGFSVFAQVFKGLGNLAKFIGRKTAHFKIEVVIHDALSTMEQLVDGRLPCSAIVPGKEEVIAGKKTENGDSWLHNTQNSPSLFLLWSKVGLRNILDVSLIII